MIIATEQDLLALGATLARECTPALTIYLSGELGAGKTTFSRGFIGALGHIGRVKSPTYTIVEAYHLPTLNIFHFDLYRIHDPEELELLGIREYINDDSILLIEWPEQGAHYLPPADIVCLIAIADGGRDVTLSAQSIKGKQVLSSI